MKAVGVSNYGPRQLEKIHMYLTARGVPVASAQVCHPAGGTCKRLVQGETVPEPAYVVHQVQFSLLSKGPQQRDIQQSCEALGIQLIAYSPLVSRCPCTAFDIHLTLFYVVPDVPGSGRWSRKNAY